MNDAKPVRLGDRHARLDDEVDGLLHGQGSAPDPGAEVGALEVLTTTPMPPAPRTRSTRYLPARTWPSTTKPIYGWAA